jgi:hypothetical protein
MMTGPTIVTPKPSGCGRRGLLQLFLEYVLLHWRPAGAAPFHRPVGDRPAFGVEDALPGDDVVLGEMLSFDHLGADARRQIGAEKRPHLIAEGELFGGEAEIHDANS